MIAVRKLTVQDHLLEIAQRRRHALHTLTKLDEAVLDELLVETSLEQPRLKVAHVPPVRADLGDVVAIEQPAQMIGDKFI